MKLQWLTREGLRGRVGAACLALIMIGTSTGAGMAETNRSVSLTAQVSLDFEEAALGDVLKVLSQQTGLGFVASEEVRGKTVTAYFDQVSAQEVLDGLVKANKLTYERMPGSNIIVVRPLTSAVQLETRVFELRYAPLAGKKTITRIVGDKTLTEDVPIGMNRVLKELVSEHGKVVEDERSNSLIVTDTPENLEVIARTITQLDQRVPQIMIEVEVIETSVDTLRRLGIEFGNSSGELMSFEGASRVTNFPFSNAYKSLVRNPPASVTPTTSQGGTTKTGATLGVLSFQELQGVLQALYTDTNTEFLARPRVLTMNNEAAFVNISANQAIGIVSTSVSDTGEVIEEPERAETGVILKVTPQVNADRHIALLLEPEVSRVVASTLFPDDFADPVKRSVKTRVMVRDGETVVIGGLISKELSDSMRRLPILGSIPFLGKAFQRQNKSEDNTEIIFFITARIANEGDKQLRESELGASTIQPAQGPEVIQLAPVTVAPRQTAGIQIAKADAVDAALDQWTGPAPAAEDYPGGSNRRSSDGSSEPGNRGFFPKPGT